MPTLLIAFDHSKVVYPTQLADELATSFSLSVMPEVQIQPAAIAVTHPNVSEANRTAITNAITAHVADPDWQYVINDNRGRLRVRAKKALVANQAYLAVGSPSNAQLLAQLRALTRQVNALIRLEVDQFDSTDDA